MALTRKVEVVRLEPTINGQTTFFEPQISHETLISEVGVSHGSELFCHRRQTDQLMLLRGAVDLIVLENARLRRITLREDESRLVRIPPGVPHGAINRSRRPAVLVNAVLRHGPSDPRDYVPRRIPANLLQAWEAILLKG